MTPKYRLLEGAEWLRKKTKGEGVCFWERGSYAPRILEPYISIVVI